MMGSGSERITPELRRLPSDDNGNPRPIGRLRAPWTASKKQVSAALRSISPLRSGEKSCSFRLPLKGIRKNLLFEPPQTLSAPGWTQKEPASFEALDLEIPWTSS